MNKADNNIRTYQPKGLIIFLLVVIGLSLVIGVANGFLVDNLALKIVIWIFCSIFFVLCLVVLVFEAINYLSLDEEKELLIIHRFLNKQKVPLNEISRIENNNGFYVFLKGKKEIYRIGTEVTGASTLIVRLEKRGIKIKW